MADIEALGILDELQALVVDKLQVVSYKWLSRNFLVSSNAAKRLLQQLVEKHDNGLEVVYTLCGWLKNNPSTYHIRLVTRPKLDEAKQEFDDDCSIQVYSVQACIPKDPTLLWNAEFVQAEELFKQPQKVDNCLLDNRFCGVSNSFVKRNTEGTSASDAAPQAKSAEVLGMSKSDCGHQAPNFPPPQQKKAQQSCSNVGLQSFSAVKDTKMESHGEGGKLAANDEKINQFPPNKKNGDKGSSGSKGSLTDMWGRASVKSKSNGAASENNTLIPNSAEAQIHSLEAVEDGNSEDEGQDVNFKRTANSECSRKRRVVMDFSDEEDEYKDAVNLALPDLPDKQISLNLKQSIKTSDLDKNNLNFEDQVEYKLKVKEDEENGKSSKQLVKEEHSTISKSKSCGIHSSGSTNVSENHSSTKLNVTGATPDSPKRRKVLKTWIDERGREVTEVVWEDKEDMKPETDTTKKADSSAKKAEVNMLNSTVNRAHAAMKPPAVGSTGPTNQVGKAGNKKAGNKDPKQGNILSFFKRRV